MATGCKLTDSDFSTLTRVLAEEWQDAQGQRPLIAHWAKAAWHSLDRLRVRAAGAHPNVIYWLVQAERAAYNFELALAMGYAQSASIRLQDWIYTVFYSLTQARLELRRHGKARAS